MNAISYRKSVAWGNPLAVYCLCWPACFCCTRLFYGYFLYSQVFCITSAIIGIPFFGGYLVVSLPKALKTDTKLLTYDQHSISDGTRTVAWAEITSISYSGPSIRKWLLPKLPVLIFHLKNRETWTVNTYYLLTDSEIQSVMKRLRGLISRNGKETK